MKFIFILLINFFILGCSILQFDAPTVVESYPSGQQVFNSTNDFQSDIMIKFSTEMSRQSVESAFSLKKVTVDNAVEDQIDGIFSWVLGDDKRSVMYYHPYSPLSFGKYKIELQKTAEDSLGNDISDITNWYFYIGTDRVLPEVIYQNPAGGETNLGRFTTNHVGFNKPMNIDNLSQLFSLSPSVRYQVIPLSNNQYFDIIPLEAMAWGKMTFTVNASSDLFGNKMRAPVSIVYTIGNDFIPPVLSALYSNTNETGPSLVTNTVNLVDKYQPLRFVFSENITMNKDNIPVVLSPSISGDWEVFSNGFQFTPAKFWDINCVYSALVNPGVEDCSGNRSEGSYHFFINSSSPTTYFLKLNSVTCAGTNWNVSNINEISGTNDFAVTLNFNSSLSPCSALENIDAVYISGGSGSGVGVSEMKVQQNLLPNDQVLIRVTGLQYGNLYKINIAGSDSGLLDSQNNYLSNDVSVYFHTSSM